MNPTKSNPSLLRLPTERNPRPRFDLGDTRVYLAEAAIVAARAAASDNPLEISLALEVLALARRDREGGAVEGGAGHDHRRNSHR